MGNTIPEHLRQSIMRLVQSQEEEEEEVARALREAHGEVPEDDGEDTVVRAIRVAEGEESEDESGDHVVVSDICRQQAKTHWSRRRKPQEDCTTATSRASSSWHISPIPKSSTEIQQRGAARRGGSSRRLRGWTMRSWKDGG